MCRSFRSIAATPLAAAPEECAARRISALTAVNYPQLATALPKLTAVKAVGAIRALFISGAL
jgi:hypothetical protein